MSNKEPPFHFLPESPKEEGAWKDVDEEEVGIRHSDPSTNAGIRAHLNSQSSGSSQGNSEEYLPNSRRDYLKRLDEAEDVDPFARPEPEEAERARRMLSRSSRGSDLEEKTMSIEPPVADIEPEILEGLRGVFRTEYLRRNSPKYMTGAQLLDLMRTFKKSGLPVRGYTKVGVDDLRTYVLDLRSRVG